MSVSDWIQLSIALMAAMGGMAAIIGWMLKPIKHMQYEQVLKPIKDMKEEQADMRKDLDRVIVYLEFRGFREAESRGFVKRRPRNAD